MLLASSNVLQSNGLPKPDLIHFTREQFGFLPARHITLFCQQHAHIINLVAQ